MVCPICVTTAVVANLPVISASIGGVVAAKVAYHQVAKRNLVREPEKSKVDVSKICKVDDTHDLKNK
jgi:hypothetical protein